MRAEGRNASGDRSANERTKQETRIEESKARGQRSERASGPHRTRLGAASGSPARVRVGWVACVALVSRALHAPSSAPVAEASLHLPSGWGLTRRDTEEQGGGRARLAQQAERSAANERRQDRGPLCREEDAELAQSGRTDGRRGRATSDQSKGNRLCDGSLRRTSLHTPLCAVVTNSLSSRSLVAQWHSIRVCVPPVQRIARPRFTITPHEWQQSAPLQPCVSRRRPTFLIRRADSVVARVPPNHQRGATSLLARSHGRRESCACIGGTSCIALPACIPWCRPFPLSSRRIDPRAG